MRCRLWWADAAVYGPWELSGGDELPPPEGGGGTDFAPFFEAVRELTVDEGVCFHLTDGFGVFPEHAPNRSTLWVVMPGGAQDEAFPFGDVIRLS